MSSFHAARGRNFGLALMMLIIQSRMRPVPGSGLDPGERGGEDRSLLRLGVSLGGGTCTGPIGDAAAGACRRVMVGRFPGLGRRNPHPVSDLTPKQGTRSDVRHGRLPHLSRTITPFRATPAWPARGILGAWSCTRQRQAGYPGSGRRGTVPGVRSARRRRRGGRGAAEAAARCRARGWRPVRHRLRPGGNRGPHRDSRHERQLWTATGSRHGPAEKAKELHEMETAGAAADGGQE